MAINNQTENMIIQLLKMKPRRAHELWITFDAYKQKHANYTIPELNEITEILTDLEAESKIRMDISGKYYITAAAELKYDKDQTQNKCEKSTQNEGSKDLAPAAPPKNNDQKDQTQNGNEKTPKDLSKFKYQCPNAKCNEIYDYFESNAKRPRKLCKKCNKKFDLKSWKIIVYDQTQNKCEKSTQNEGPKDLAPAAPPKNNDQKDQSQNKSENSSIELLSDPITEKILTGIRDHLYSSAIAKKYNLPIIKVHRIIQQLLRVNLIVEDISVGKYPKFFSVNELQFSRLKIQQTDSKMWPITVDIHKFTVHVPLDISNKKPNSKTGTWKHFFDRELYDWKVNRGLKNMDVYSIDLKDWKIEVFLKQALMTYKHDLLSVKEIRKAFDEMIPQVPLEFLENRGIKIKRDEIYYSSNEGHYVFRGTELAEIGKYITATIKDEKNQTQFSMDHSPDKGEHFEVHNIDKAQGIIDVPKNLENLTALVKSLNSQIIKKDQQIDQLTKRVGDLTDQLSQFFSHLTGVNHSTPPSPPPNIYQ